jgi:hypothetical protein
MASPVALTFGNSPQEFRRGLNCDSDKRIDYLNGYNFRDSPMHNAIATRTRCQRLVHTHCHRSGGECAAAGSLKNTSLLVVIVHYSRSGCRLQMVRDQLRALGLPHKPPEMLVATGWDYQDLTPMVLNKCAARKFCDGPPITNNSQAERHKAQKSVLMVTSSILHHMLAWTIAAATSGRATVILEDDVWLPQRFPAHDARSLPHALSTALATMPPDWHLLNFGCRHCGSPHRGREPAKFDRFGACFCSRAYMVSRTGAVLLWTHNPFVSRPIDGMLPRLPRRLTPRV